MKSAADLTLDRFRPLVDSAFAATGLGRSARLELISATALPRHQPTTGEKFSLVFRGSEETPLSQGIHTLESPEAGRLELFLVPIIATERGVRHYEAVINREVPA